MNAMDWLNEQIDVTGIVRYNTSERGPDFVDRGYSKGPVRILRANFFRDYQSAVRKRDELNEAILSMRNVIGDVK